MLDTLIIVYSVVYSVTFCVPYEYGGGRKA